MWSFSWASTALAIFLASGKECAMIALLSWINEADKNFAASKSQAHSSGNGGHFMTYCTRGPRCSFVQKKERARMISEAEKGSSSIVRLSTMHSVWKSLKKSHSTLRGSELRLHFEWTKVHPKCQKMVQFDEFLTNWSYLSNSVTRQATFNRTKIARKCQNWKTQMQHFGWFSNTVIQKISHL